MLSGTILCKIVKTNIRGIKISSSIPSKNSIQDRQSIIAQAAARGLQLSEDGMSWVPINPKSNDILLNQSNVKVVKKLPSDISLSDSNVIIVKNGSEVSNSGVTVIAIWYVMGALAVIASIVFIFFWLESLKPIRIK